MNMHYNEWDDSVARRFAGEILKSLDEAKALGLNLAMPLSELLALDNPERQHLYNLQQGVVNKAAGINVGLGSTCRYRDGGSLQVRKETFDYVIDALKQTREAVGEAPHMKYISELYDATLRRALMLRPEWLSEETMSYCNEHGGVLIPETGLDANWMHKNPKII